MCGIVGKLYPQADRPVEPEALRAMCESVVHRGPDAAGYYLKGTVGLAMRRPSDLQPTLDWQALSHYLSLLYIPAPYTIYREIRKLEPGHILVWEAGQGAVRQYWDLSQVRPSAVDRRQLATVEADLLDLLTEAVRCHLISDVPLGVFLSGGLDSSTIVAVMRRAHNGPIKTFSIGFDDPSYRSEEHTSELQSPMYL